MRKVIWIVGSILIIAILVLLMIRKVYKDSPDYNYISAKLDIKNGNLRIINIGSRTLSLKDKEIDSLSEKYGFKNVYVGNDAAKHIILGIDNYNEVMETYLKVRNGANWRKKYQWEIDSLYRVASTQNN